MYYNKKIDGMTYEFFGPDPFHKNRVNTLQTLHKQQLAHLSKGPQLAEPIIHEIVMLAYKGWHLTLRCVFWTLSWADGKFRELADI